MPNVKFFFNHKLTGADFKRRKAWFEVRGQDSSSSRPEEVEISFDFMIGADGAHSAVRYHLMKYTRMNYQQEYVDTLWCEFTITPRVGAELYYEGSKFRISPNYLHIWPGKQFMFIAIPSEVCSNISSLLAAILIYHRMVPLRAPSSCQEPNSRNWKQTLRDFRHFLISILQA